MWKRIESYWHISMRHACISRHCGIPCSGIPNVLIFHSRITEAEMVRPSAWKKSSNFIKLFSRNEWKSHSCTLMWQTIPTALAVKSWTKQCWRTTRQTQTVPTSFLFSLYCFVSCYCFYLVIVGIYTINIVLFLDYRKKKRLSLNKARNRYGMNVLYTVHLGREWERGQDLKRQG